MTEQQIRAIIREEIARYQQFQNPTFNKHIKLENGVDISTTGDRGSRIGTSSNEKLGFFGAQPVVQQSSITSPSGGGTVDSESRTAIGSIITTLRTLGFIS